MMTYARDKSWSGWQGALAALVIGVASSICYGQPDAGGASAPSSSEVGTPKVRPNNAESAAELEGMWPSKKLVRLVLVRMADRVAGRYDLSEQQSRELREATVDRWTRFAQQHRPELQPLVNEFLEMRMGLEPPSKERVQAWAQRLEPMFELYRAEFDEAVDEFRGMLTPAQRAQFEVEAFKHQAGLALAESNIRKWQAGEFAPDELWNRPGRSEADDASDSPGDHGAEATTAVASSEEGAPVEAQGPVDQIALELRAWEDYAARFIQRYGLDEGQRDAVRSCLSELKQRARAHRDRRWEEIVALERTIEEHAGSEDELAEIEKQLVELYGPVDAMFQELKERIHKIPTDAQRAAVQAREDADAGEG